MPDPALTPRTRALWAGLMRADPHPDPLIRRLEYQAWAEHATAEEVLAEANARAVRAVTEVARDVFTAVTGLSSAAVLGATDFSPDVDDYVLWPPQPKEVSPM